MIHYENIYCFNFNQMVSFKITQYYLEIEILSLLDNPVVTSFANICGVSVS
jgi:hypothetical protein